ncbi:MAG: PadR family transcriptional regulator [Methanomassiliicoccales archaeon]
MSMERWPEDKVSRSFHRSSFKTGFLKLAILKIVEVKPMHGYALMKEIERVTGEDWKPSPGSVYPALQEMVADGLLLVSEDGRKRVYEITAEGKRFSTFGLEHARRVLMQLERLLSQ